MSDLKTAQQKAIQFVDSYAKERCINSLNVLTVICDRSNKNPQIIDTIIKNIQQNAQIAVHFHPDTINSKGISVSQSLYDCGMYQNQFEMNERKQIHINGLMYYLQQKSQCQSLRYYLMQDL